MNQLMIQVETDSGLMIVTDSEILQIARANYKFALYPIDRACLADKMYSVAQF